MDSDARPRNVRTLFADSYALVKESIVRTRQHPKLIGFAVLTAVASLVYLAVIVGIGYLAYQYGYLPSFSPDADPAAALVASELALMGVLSFGVAFICFMGMGAIMAAMRRIQNGASTPTVMSRVPTILSWTLITGVVSVISISASEYLGTPGSVLDTVISFFWPLITIFVVVLLVVEGMPVIEAIKRSFELFRKSLLVVIVTSALLGIVFILPVIILVLLGVAAATVFAGNGLLVGIAFGLLACIGVLFAFAYMTASSINMLVLYDHVSRKAVAGASLPSDPAVA